MEIKLSNIQIDINDDITSNKKHIKKKSIVIAIKTNILILKSEVNTRGLIMAPNPINKHKFRILEPEILPNNKSVSFFLAAIIPVIISGKAVPTATTVIPINRSDKPSFWAMRIELSTTKSEPNFNPNIPKIKYYIFYLFWA